eukprot:268444_1
MQVNQMTDGESVQSLTSETIPLFDIRGKASDIINKYCISWFDVYVLTFACTLAQLTQKSWTVFAAFVDSEYRIHFYELSWSLAIIALSPLPVMWIVPWLNTFKCHYLCFIALAFSMALAILNSILSGSIFNLFIVSFARVFLCQIFWTMGNSIIFHFMKEADSDKKWKKNAATTLFMGASTFSTFLYLGSGPLIDAYGFRVTMIMIASLNLITIDAPNVDHTSTLSHLWILFSDVSVTVIMIHVLATVTNWGMYYGSFGIWMTHLFHLDAERLGMYVVLCEASAELTALCSIPIISKYVRNHHLCIIGGICETSAIVIFNVLLWNDGYILNEYVLTLPSEWMQIGIILCVIFCFEMGHEFLYVSLFVNLHLVPRKQHNTAVALYGCFDYFGGFIGQTFVTYVFNKNGMAAMAPYMLIVEGVSIMCLISRHTIMHKEQSKLLNVVRIIDSPKIH